jgi:hypothetical protein
MQPLTCGARRVCVCNCVGVVPHFRVANPGQLVNWIDRATPSAAACSFVLALGMVGPHTAAFCMFVISSEFVPGREAHVQWACVVILILSVTMNYLWQSKSEQLTSRCRIFLLLPGNNQMQVLRSAVLWIESYESGRKQVSSAVERWWSETGDGCTHGRTHAHTHTHTHMRTGISYYARCPYGSLANLGPR